MNALLKSLIWFLYPSQCRHCGENLDPADGHYICKRCWDQVIYIDRPYCERCGKPLDRISASSSPCADCLKLGEVRFGKARSIAYYHDSVIDEAIKLPSQVGKAIILLKDNGKTIMAGKLAEIMAKGADDLLDMNDYDCIVPVPIHKKKLRKRGYNQMDLIGRKMSVKLGIPMDAQSLIKEKNTPPQRGLKAIDRVQNIKGSFSIIDPSKISGKRVLLIDDVMTTGSTANECARVLLKDGKASNVDVLTLTRAGYSDLIDNV